VGGESGQSAEAGPPQAGPGAGARALAVPQAGPLAGAGPRTLAKAGPPAGPRALEPLAGAGPLAPAAALSPAIGVGYGISEGLAKFEELRALLPSSLSSGTGLGRIVEMSSSRRIWSWALGTSCGWG